MAVVETSTLTVALVGNPNTGKSTLFTALAGVRQRIGNYPGVTVEKKVGHLEHGGRRLALVDLPGTYSLAPRSLDEMVTVDVLLGRRQDVAPCNAVVCIVDASNLERNLYLVSQVLELGLPTVLALNMIDVARERGIKIDVAQLQQRLGVPVVSVQANKRIGLEALKTELMRVVESEAVARISPFPAAFQDEVARLEELVNSFRNSPLSLENGRAPAPGETLQRPHPGPLPEGAGDLESKPQAAVPRYLVERLLLDTSGYLEGRGALAGHVPANGQLHDQLQAARDRLATAGFPVPAVEAMVRYEWVGKMLDGVIFRPSERTETFSDKIDRVLTHRLWGTVVFVVVMFALFSSIFIAAQPLMDLIDGGVSAFGELIQNSMSEGALRSLLVKGIIGGVGSVIVFLPQILILFMFIAILEDCGYMARAAYLMDKLMVRVGLSGKSFIPLLSSFACAIPGIMATRVIENRRDRLTTILIAPLMSCSARLPVYFLLIGAFIPAKVYLGGLLPLQGLVMFGMYLVGIIAAAVVALVLKRTMLRGPTPAFVMELPPYKIPSLRLVLERMVERGWSFIKRAGTLIVAVAIVVWALLYYPHDEAAVEAGLAKQKQAIAQQIAELPTNDSHREFLAGELARFDDPEQHQQLAIGAMQRQSYLGRLGRFIEPAVKPLGWDWRVGSAVLASFPAREVVLGTMGVIYNLGEDVELDTEEGQTQLQAQLHNATWDGTNRTVFTVPMALGLMVFFALCAQCGATLVIIKRETGSWRWPAFTFAYMTALAYLGALATYQIGSMF